MTNILASETKEVLETREIDGFVWSNRLDKKLDGIRPLFLLMKRDMCPCESLILNGNALTRADVAALGMSSSPFFGARHKLTKENISLGPP